MDARFRCRATTDGALAPAPLHRTANPCTLTTRLEDFSNDWDGTIHRIWDLLGVRDPAMITRLTDEVASHNVYSKGKPLRYNRHVSNASSGRDGMRRRGATAICRNIASDAL